MQSPVRSDASRDASTLSVHVLRAGAAAERAVRDLTKKQFLAELERNGWRPTGWQPDGSPYRHEETKTTSYGPDRMRRRELVEYLKEVAEYRRRVA